MGLFESFFLIHAHQALWHVLGLLLQVVLFSSHPGEVRAVQASARVQEASAPAPSAPAPFVFEPGAEVPPVRFPRAETLTYRAYLDLAMISTQVGIVTQTSRVEQERQGVIVSRPSGGEAACVRLHAEGGYLMYSLESTIETRLQPRDWPRIVNSSTTQGKDERRREVLLGTKEGVPTSSYRGDTDKNAPAGGRIWREAKLRAVPAGTLDMLSGVMMTRTLVEDHLESITFPLLDKDRVWQVKLRRGQRRRMETGAGTFDVVEIVIDPTPHPGEDISEKKLKRFEGVFGIHGTIHLWVEEHTGIAVRIQGDLPVGLGVTLGVDVVLDSYSGTPAAFQQAQR